MMSFYRFFKPGQKVILRTLAPAVQPGRIESLTAYLQESASGEFDLLLPYGSPEGEQYPFCPDMPFELLSDGLGMGLRMTGSFRKQVQKDLIRIAVNNDLQVFQRRQYRRLDLTAGLRYTKGRGTLRSFREQWEKNLQILQKSADPTRISGFPRAPINLSAGGIRFSVKAPAQVADLCLLLLELESLPPICALAEVVWVEEQVREGRQIAGMRFIHILEADQKRIDEYVRANAPKLETPSDRGSDY